ncbi:hypothetical protein [Pseudomonas sp. CF161]|uniref:hypothetical protein n=1 Tax=Pseudomonas sp. CF161 TaxID=911241 RepID=UPI0012EB422B|nr:hypothetical protein [Pseudomonas sp. CF161]
MKIENASASLMTVNGQPRKSDEKVSTRDSGDFAQVLASASSTTVAKTAGTGSPASQGKVSVENYRTDLVNVAKADNSEAEKLLEYNTSNTFHPLIDISGWPSVRYSVTGELQTPESTAYFAHVNASAVKERMALVQAERSQGTPAAEILDKVLAFNSALPSRFKEMANIFY